MANPCDCAVCVVSRYTKPDAEGRWVFDPPDPPKSSEGDAVAIERTWRCEECKLPWDPIGGQCRRCGNRSIEPIPDHFAASSDTPESTPQGQ